MLAEARVETNAELGACRSAGPAPVKGRSLWRDAGFPLRAQPRGDGQRHRAGADRSLYLHRAVLCCVVDRKDRLVAWSAWSAKGLPSFASGHYFGTDEVGRDLYSRVIQGTEISLAVGVMGAAVAVTFGTLYGAIAGYFGGRLDTVMKRFVDII